MLLYSMSDMDWWLKMKIRTVQDLVQSDNEIISEEELDDLLGLLYQNSVENEDALDESKRNIASVWNLGLDYKSVAALSWNINFVVHEEKRDSVDTNQGKLLRISDILNRCGVLMDQCSKSYLWLHDLFGMYITFWYKNICLFITLLKVDNPNVLLHIFFYKNIAFSM